MTDSLKEQIFDLVTNPPCRECEFWDKPGHYCFLSRLLPEKTIKCKLVNRILALGLYQLDEDQSLPGFISNPEDWTVEDAEYETTRRLREAGWRKVKHA